VRGGLEGAGALDQLGLFAGPERDLAQLAEKTVFK
jgi:hypothetical protein